MFNEKLTKPRENGKVFKTLEKKIVLLIYFYFSTRSYCIALAGLELIL